MPSRALTEHQEWISGPEGREVSDVYSLKDELKMHWRVVMQPNEWGCLRDRRWQWHRCQFAEIERIIGDHRYFRFAMVAYVARIQLQLAFFSFAASCFLAFHICVTSMVGTHLPFPIERKHALVFKRSNFYWAAQRRVKIPLSTEKSGMESTNTALAIRVWLA